MLKKPKSYLIERAIVSAKLIYTLEAESSSQKSSTVSAQSGDHTVQDDACLKDLMNGLNEKF